MPELPEVETVRRQLDARLRGRTLASVRFLKRGREFPKEPAFSKMVAGKRIVEIARRAKLLVWKFGDGTALTAHLKMTGRFVFVEADYQPQKHDRATFDFGGVHLVWNDVRQFGFLKLMDAGELEKTLEAYGPEPLETAAEELAERLRAPKTRTIKAALLDQTTIAGVGNIYADEACHRAGIRPSRRLGTLTAADRLNLAKKIREILTESIAQKGTSANDYVDTAGERGGFLSLLRVYGRGGEPCRTCGTPIKKTVQHQRGTHYCPRCQD